VYFFKAFDNFVQLNDAGVIETAQNLNLSLDAAELIIPEFILIIYLNSYFSFVVPIDSALDQGMRPPAQISMKLYPFKQLLNQFFLFLVLFVVSFHFLCLLFFLDRSRSTGSLLLLLSLTFCDVISLHEKWFVPRKRRFRTLLIFWIFWLHLWVLLIYIGFATLRVLGGKRMSRSWSDRFPRFRSNADSRMSSLGSDFISSNILHVVIVLVGWRSHAIYSRTAQRI